MSSRGRRGRGRPPKSAVLSHRPSLLKKPRYLYAGSGAQGSRVGLQLRPYDGPAVQPQLRQRLREKSQKVRTFIQSVLGDEEDNDFEAPSSADESDYQRGAEDDDDEERESVASYESDDASVYSQSSYSTISSSTPAKRKWTRRPHSPVFLQEREIPPLALPKSSEDLILPTCHIMRALSIYESLRHFRNILRLTPFRFEDFCVALMSDEQSALLSEAHIALLRAILREEEAAGTQFGPQDLKDSINVHLYMVDAVTWPAVLRMYLGSDPDFRSMLSALERCEYPFTTVASKLNVLEFLCDQFLTTAQAREDITSEGVAKHDDHCRVCHKLGDLLCCETCPAVFHLACLDPPLTDVPTEDWICTVCQANQTRKRGYAPRREEELRIAIHARNKPKTKGRPPVLLLDQAVPSGAFADPHQLRLLDDGDAEFAVPDRVDVERLQHEASPHRVFVFVALNSSQSDVLLPVHLRYHRARHCHKEGAFSTVILRPPAFHFRFPDSEFADDCEELHRLPCSHYDLEKTCAWKRFHIDGVGDLQAEVPVGCLEDSFVVSTVTLVTYSLCSVAVAYFVVIHGKKRRPD
ncbi:putative fetal alzheimer antigen [Ixodes scapularis]